MKPTYFVLILFFSGCISTNKISNINLEFMDSNNAESRYIGLVGVPSKKFQNFTQLWNKLNKRQKKELAKNGNLIAKFYSSQKLINEKSDFIIEIFAENLNDHRTIVYLKGDVQRPTEISLEMLMLVNELIGIKTEPSPFDNIKGPQDTKRAIRKYKDYVKINGDNRPGYIEYLNTELKYAEEFDNWKLKELTKLKEMMHQVVRENNNSSEKISELIVQ